MRTYVAAILLLGVALSLYANTLGGGFIWDDEFLIEKNRYLESWRYLPDIFQSSLHAFAPVQSNYYRPLQTVSYLLDRTLWGDGLWGYHLTNIFLHGLVGVALYLFGLALGIGSLSSFWIALFFTAHPLHTEAVSYLSGRADSLSALFILLSLLCFHRFLKRNSFRTYLFSFSFFLLALLSKEIAVTLPFLILLLLWHEKRKKNWELLFPFFLLLFLYGALRLTLLDFRGAAPFQVQKTDGTFFERGKVGLQSLLLYLKLILFPFPLYMERRIPYRGSFWTVDSVLGVCVLLFFWVIAKGRTEKRKTLFGWGWFLILTLPSSSLFLRTDRIAEHFIYLALFGLFVALIPAGLMSFSSFERGEWKRGVGGAAGALLILYFSTRTYTQNKIWSEPQKFYENILAHVPENWTALNNLGALLEKKGDRDRAGALLRKAIRLEPHRPESHSNLGTLLLKKGDLNGAMEEYREALRLWPTSPELHNNLASAYRLKGEWGKAVFEYRLALQFDPHLVESRYFLAKTYEAMGKKDIAEEQYRYLKERGLQVEVFK